MSSQMLSQGGYYPTRGEQVFENIFNDILNSGLSEFTLLDIGCGGGIFLNALLSKIKSDPRFNLENIKLVGIDHYEGYKKHFQDKKIFFKLGDIFDIDQLYPPDYFDFITCSEVLEHVERTDDLVKKMRKVLKPGGRLYITTPNLASYHGRLSSLLGLQPLVTEVSNEYASFGKGFLDRFYSGKDAKGEPIHHVRVFTSKALKEFIEFHGFQILDMDGFGFKVPWLWKYLSFLAPVTRVICKKKDEK